MFAVNELLSECSFIVGHGVVMLDDHNQIEWSNAIAESHFGLDAKRDLRQHITHLVRQPDFVRYLNLQRYDEDLHMRGMGENRQNVIAVQAFPYGDNRKLILTQDITELERTDAMRRDFVANVSHELKTPLTVLSGFLETMRELPLSEADRNRYLDIMAQQGARMQIIVNDLLSWRKEYRDEDTMTTVRVLCEDQGLPLQTAVDRLCALAERHEREYLAARDRLLAGPAGQDPGIVAYLAGLDALAPFVARTSR